MGQLFGHHAAPTASTDLSDSGYLDVGKLAPLQPNTSNLMPTLDQLQPVGGSTAGRVASGISSFLSPLVGAFGGSPRRGGGGNNSPITIPDQSHVDLGAEEDQWQRALDAFRGN